MMATLRAFANSLLDIRCSRQDAPCSADSTRTRLHKKSDRHPSRAATALLWRACRRLGAQSSPSPSDKVVIDMKVFPLIGLLVITCVAGAAISAPSVTRNERLVKAIDLQGFFHTAHPWQLKIYQPVGADAPYGNRPVRVCFAGPMDAARPHTDCTALFGKVVRTDGVGYPLQTLDAVVLQQLPGPADSATRPSLVLRATYGGGGAGELKDLLVWTDTSADHQGRFNRIFRSEVSEAGEQQFVTHGPLAGTFVALDQVATGNEANMESPIHYRMAVYAPVSAGYVEVLGLLSEQRYPSNHTRDGLPDAVTTLTPEISHALKAVYPNGLAALAK